MKSRITAFSLVYLFFNSFLLPAGIIAENTTAGTPALKEFLVSPLKNSEVAFRFLGSSTVIIRAADQLILVDPAAFFDEKEMPLLKASGISCIVYTHGHGDHFNAAKAAQLFSLSQPFIVCTADLAGQLAQKIPASKIITAKAGKPFTAGKITFDTVQGVHPGGILMYRMKIGNLTIFHGGDSGYVPLQDYPSQLAFLPIGGASPTASPDDAVNMAADLKPQTVVVMHGKDNQPAEFMKKINAKLPSVKVIIPKQNECETITID